MLNSTIFAAAVCIVALSAWRLVAMLRTSDRVGRSGPANNWQNEGYMSKQAGRSWSEIDGTIAGGAPSQCQVPGTEG